MSLYYCFPCYFIVFDFMKQLHSWSYKFWWKRKKKRNQSPAVLVILHAVLQGLACFQLLVTPGGLTTRISNLSEMAVSRCFTVTAWMQFPRGPSELWSRISELGQWCGKCMKPLICDNKEWLMALVITYHGNIFTVLSQQRQSSAFPATVRPDYI